MKSKILSIIRKGTNIRGSNNGAAYMVKIENGSKYYSMDGGQTWSEDIPEGRSERVPVGGQIKTR